MGLSIIYGIVKQSGGDIRVYSEPGHGTTFKVYLPQTEATRDWAAGKTAVGITFGAGEHILVVEDDESIRKVMLNLLSRLGYAVTLAADGGEALQLVEEKGLKPDLIITDVIMPNINGKQLIDRLRLNQPHLKALFMSGYTDNAIGHQGLLPPGMAFIQKPFNILDLGNRVRDALKGSS